MNDKYYNLIKKSLAEWVAIPSVKSAPCEGKPFGAEVYRVLCSALKLSESLGFDVSNIDGYAGTAEIGSGTPFGVIVHLDVMPVGGGWTSPAFELAERGGKLYGRGVSDDKGPALCALYAVRSLLDEGLRPKRQIRFIFGCDEESGWGCIKHIKPLGVIPEEGISPDADFPVINCEKGILHLKLSFDGVKDLVEISGGQRANMVADYCKATYRYKGELVKAETHGVAAHGSTPELGENAIEKMIGLLAEKLPELVPYTEMFATDGSGLNLNISDDKSGKLSSNFGIVLGDKNSLDFTVDIRYPISFSREDIIARIQQISPKVRVEVLEEQRPLFVDEKAPLVTALLSAFREVTGEKTARPITIGGGTYARAMKRGVAFGMTFPGEQSTAHMPNECVSVESVKTAFEIYRSAFRKICF